LFTDAGNGVGYTGIRVRGSDATRVNVTINGIPYNDSESHGTYWVNMPDFASSLESLQLQRGVGTSTNGAGAFGASLNMLTDSIKRK
jgi:iron complex outermembrane receptor protein